MQFSKLQAGLTCRSATFAAVILLGVVAVSGYSARGESGGGASDLAVVMPTPRPARLPPIKPFGVTFGAPVSTLSNVMDYHNGSYGFDPPLPSRPFKLFVARAAPRSGVCKVIGMGVPQPPSQTDALVEEVTALAEELGRRYGNSSHIDDAAHLPFAKMRDADDPHRRGPASVTHERNFMWFFGVDHGSKMPSNIDGIILEIVRVGPGIAPMVVYEGSAFGACRAEIEAEHM